MFFRRRRQRDPRSEAWASLAERLELVRLDEAATEALRAELGIDTGRVSEAHAWRREGLPDLLLFEHARPRQGGRGAEEPRVRLLLRAEGMPSEPSWRAFAKSHPLLASLQASRSGGELVRSDDPAFDERIGVVSREPEVVAERLTPVARDALASLLEGEELPDATVTSGHGHLAWRASARVEPPFEVLEAVAARLLVLWLALGGSVAEPREDAGRDDAGRDGAGQDDEEPFG